MRVGNVGRCQTYLCVFVFRLLLFKPFVFADFAVLAVADGGVLHGGYEEVILLSVDAWDEVVLACIDIINKLVLDIVCHWGTYIHDSDFPSVEFELALNDIVESEFIAKLGCVGSTLLGGGVNEDYGFFDFLVDVVATEVFAKSFESAVIHVVHGLEEHEGVLSFELVVLSNAHTVDSVVEVVAEKEWKVGVEVGIEVAGVVDGLDFVEVGCFPFDACACFVLGAEFLLKLAIEDGLFGGLVGRVAMYLFGELLVVGVGGFLDEFFAEDAYLKEKGSHGTLEVLDIVFGYASATEDGKVGDGREVEVGGRLTAEFLEFVTELRAVHEGMSIALFFGNLELCKHSSYLFVDVGGDS